MCKSIVYAPGRSTIDTALMQSGLAFTAAKRLVKDETGEYEIPGMYRIARVDTNKTVGINKGGRYNVLQHFEAVRHGLSNLFDDLDGEIVSSVLNLYNGRIAVVTVDLAESSIIGHDSVIGKLNIFNDHGDGGYGGMVSDQRPVCINTYKIATAQAVAIGKYICNRHTGDVISKMRETAVILGLAKEAHDNFGESARHLANTPADVALHRRFFETLYNIPDKIEDRTGQQRNMLEKLFELTETGKGADIPGVKGSMWGAVNAATEHAQHYATRRGDNKDDARQHDALFGDHSVRAMDVALKLASV